MTDVPLKDSQAERENASLLSNYILLRPSTNWIRPTHIKESNLFYLVCQFKC